MAYSVMLFVALSDTKTSKMSTFKDKEETKEGSTALIVPNTGGFL